MRLSKVMTASKFPICHYLVDSLYLSTRTNVFMKSDSHLRQREGYLGRELSKRGHALSSRLYFASDLLFCAVNSGLFQNIEGIDVMVGMELAWMYRFDTC